MGKLLRDAFKYYKRHIFLIAALTLAVWVPCELAQSYCEAYVFKPNDIRASFRLARLLEAVFGTIAMAGILCALERDAEGRPPLVAHSFRDGLSFWGRLWWAYFAFGLTLLVGIIALVVPALFVLVHCSLLPAVVVREEVTGFQAVKRCFAITRGYFLRLLGWFFCAGLLAVLAGSPFLVLAAFFDHWIPAALLTACFDVALAFLTVFTWVVLRRILGETEPHDAYAE
jgi:hypothetical protein